MPLIEYDEPRIHVLRGSRNERNQQVEFEFHPGAVNDVPGEVWENLKKHSTGCKVLLRQGKLREVKLPKVAPSPTPAPEPEPSKPGRLAALPEGDEEPGEPETVDDLDSMDITSYNALELVEFIPKVYDLDVLARFKEQEQSKPRGGRKTVLEALERQIAQMSTDPTQETQTARGA